MNFLTPVNIPEYSFSVHHQQQVLLLGSCFSENIGQKLKESKFQTTINPFGIIYNPISITNALKHIIEGRCYTKNELYNYNGKWLSWDHHGKFSSSSEEITLHQINDSLTKAQETFNKTETVFITLGSAWVYEFIETNKLVANCHKLPSPSFTKRLLEVNEIVTSFSKIIEQHPGVKFIFTVSPVRHIKDGLSENNISKGVLHSAIHKLGQQFSNCFYFPAYEIVVDELRDYRFYKEDMVHPNQQAINYVWEKLKPSIFNEETVAMISKIEKLNNAINHKPFDFKSEQHQTFIKSQVKIMEQMEEQYNYLNFEQEKKRLTEQTN